MRLHTAAGWRSLLFSTLLCTGTWAKKDKPSVKNNRFDFLPRNVNYFEDSDVLLFEDDFHKDVYRSTDGGATWDKLDEGKGKMLEISMHPFDKKRAYIITEEKTHYKTSDQGKTWEALPKGVRSNPIELPGNRLAGLAESQVMVSADGGATWAKVGPPIPFKPNGITYSDKGKAFYAWKLSDNKKMDRGSVVRLTAE